MITLPGKEVASISILTTFGEDEFNEISYAQVTEGKIGDDLTKYYIVK